MQTSPSDRLGDHELGWLYCCYRGDADGEPVLHVTARVGARFVNALRPSRNLTDSETQARLAEYYGLPKFCAELAPKRWNTTTKHKLKQGAEILAAMKAVSWGPSVRSYVKGGVSALAAWKKVNGPESIKTTSH